MPQNMYGKENAVGARFSWNLTSSIIVYCRSNVKPHAGWTIFLCHLSENEYSEQVSVNVRNGEILDFFVDNNFHRH